jgi:hypothetical protein
MAGYVVRGSIKGLEAAEGKKKPTKSPLQRRLERGEIVKGRVPIDQIILGDGQHRSTGREQVGKAGDGQKTFEPRFSGDRPASGSR